MYNRYIPQPDGSHRREWIQDPPPRPAQPQKPPKEPDCPPPPPPPVHDPPKAPPCPPPSRQNTGASGFLQQLLPQNLDTGDLLILLLLLLMAGDRPEDRSTALLTLVLYLLM